MKFCGGCKRDLPDKAFWRRGKNGLQGRCKACCVSVHRDWMCENKDHYNKYQKDLRRGTGRVGYLSRLKTQQSEQRKNRDLVWKAYGNRCCICGEDDPLTLEIDHIFNDYAADAKRLNGGMPGALYKDLIARSFPRDRYQLLCANCNGAKRRNGGKNPMWRLGLRSA